MELTETRKPNPKSPWSPTGIAVLTLFFSPFVGGILHGLNYGRLGQPLYRRFVLTRNLLAAILLIVFSNLPSLSHPGLLITTTLLFSAYFYKTQEQAFQSHRSQGGGKASFLLPILLSVIVSSLFFILLLSMR